ncbi:unnamed protein product [Cylicocyclus nassatus]|uniref:Uncharacterized protein n=1 Tax=Cylicocyclus nassatus TaxID=53992 RepID=A0AA36M6G2_CYLNA|nr:unnamed protein product [Cylicocyclus nassatus]
MPWIGLVLVLFHTCACAVPTEVEVTNKTLAELLTPPDATAKVNSLPDSTEATTAENASSVTVTTTSNEEMLYEEEMLYYEESLVAGGKEDIIDQREEDVEAAVVGEDTIMGDTNGVEEAINVAETVAEIQIAIGGETSRKIGTNEKALPKCAFVV